MFYLLTSTIGSVIGGAFNTVTSAASSVAATATTAAQSAEAGAGGIAGAVQSVIGGEGSAELGDAATAAVRAIVSGDEASADAAREEAAQALATTEGIPVEEARTRIETYEAQYRQSMNGMDGPWRGPPNGLQLASPLRERLPNWLHPYLVAEVARLENGKDRDEWTSASYPAPTASPRLFLAKTRRPGQVASRTRSGSNCPAGARLAALLAFEFPPALLRPDRGKAEPTALGGRCSTVLRTRWSAP